MKTCVHCGVEKQNHEFSPHKLTKDHLDSYCRKCAVENARNWYRENRDLALARSKQRYRDNHEEMLAYHRAYTRDVRRSRMDERQRFLSLMKAGVGCTDCGRTDGRLDFHHRKNETKSFNVSQRVLAPWWKLAAEIFKCDVLCPSCHTKRHWDAKRELASVAS